MRFFSVLLLSIVVVASASFAQKSSHPSFHYKGGSFFPHAATVHGDTLKVLAIMVQFQTDNDPKTTGDGTFELTASSSDTMIDPPPHDQNYFSNHLQFAENYFERVSNHKLHIRSTVINQVFTLQKNMESYSPSIKANNNTPLAQMAYDSWKMVDSLRKDVDLSQYDAFIIFHAGAGRDFALADIGNPLPYNIPSIFLSLQSLQQIYGSSFNGIPVQNGSFNIPSVIILPETESFTIGEGAFASEISYSINGLLAAMIGNYLGLPDLYNTATGASGIGRFGLMDGASIFSYSGLFPPEPSAWERIYLGWAHAIELPPGTSLLQAHAVGLHDGSDSIIFKVPISPTEYYLIENRNRDPHNNGQLLKMVVNGKLDSIRFKDDSSDIAIFNENNIEAIHGVVVDVEDYDWSLPGGIDQNNKIFNGGIVIWHINENIITSQLAADAINNDIHHRGVSVVEADGATDIGQTYGTFDPAAGSEYGSVFDFWYRGNPVPTYANRFDENSQPPARSTSGSPVHIAISDFSLPGPIMSCSVRIGNDLIGPIAGLPKRVPNILSNQTITNVFGSLNAQPILLLPTTLGLYGINLPGLSNGSPTSGWVCDTTGLITNNSSITQTAFVQTDTTKTFAAIDSTHIIFFDAGTQPCSGDNNLPITTGAVIDLQKNITCLCAFNNEQFLVGDAQGFVTIISRSGAIGEPVQVSQKPIIGLIRTSLSSNPWFACTRDKGKFANGTVIDFGSREARAAVYGDINGDGNNEITIVTTSNEVLVYSLDGSLLSQAGITGVTGTISNVALADLRLDSKPELIFTSGNSIYAVRYNGVPIDNFPIRCSAYQNGLTSPVIGDIDGDGYPDIIFGRAEGELVAYSSKGKILNGFPVTVGSSAITTPVIFNYLGKTAFATATTNGNVLAWQYNSTYQDGSMPWPALFGSTARSNALLVSNSITPTPPISEFFPASRAYNWPNPAYDGKTYIRYYLGSQATVTITIYDLSGDKVTQFNAPGMAGVDNEVLWDTSKVQSGIYLAKIDARGQNANALKYIKIAVVR